MNKNEILRAFKEFCDRNEFELNPDKEHVDFCIDGLLANEKKYGLKFCPCRIVSGDIKKDVEIICPCNFTMQDKYRSKSECWCGLFTKKGRKVTTE